MGGRSSVPQDQMNDHAQPFPDLNDIFRELPKMMQIAEDMHRMTDYVMDLRNMTFGFLCFATFGALIFLIMKFVQGRSRRAYRKHSMERRFEVIGDRSLPRHMHYNGYQGFCEPWPDTRPKVSTSIDMDKVQLSNCGQNDASDHMSESSPRPSDNRSLPNGHAHHKV